MFDWGFIESDGVTTIGGASWKSEAEQRKVLAWIPELDEDMPIFVIDLLDEKGDIATLLIAMKRQHSSLDSMKRNVKLVTKH